MEKIKIISAQWSAPKHVRALTTTRMGGVSAGPYENFNLGDHVDDDGYAVRMNRAIFRQALRLPSNPVWLKQVHGTHVVDAATVAEGTTADGAYTNQPGVVLAVLTADCLPIFLCDRKGTEVGIVHAGWRGLAAGVVEAGVEAMGSPRQQLMAHLGPGIGAESYEVGEEVHEEFVRQDEKASRAFAPAAEGKWMADMYELARMRLRTIGVTAITGGTYCTFRERDKFFSYRRDGATGRMVSAIWLVPTKRAVALEE